MENSVNSNVKIKRKRMSVLEKWIKTNGGTRAIAKKLNLTQTIMYKWFNHEGWPKVETILELRRLSKGELTFDNILKSTATPEMKRRFKL